MRTFSVVKYLFITSLCGYLAACTSSDTGAIDKLLGNFSSAPILTSIPDQTVQQEDLLKVDVNNIKDGIPGNDKDMSYTCVYDTEVDGKVTATTACADLPNSTASFDAAAGILQWTPHSGVLGNYEFKITGKNADGTYDEIFSVGVRLKFSGIGLYTQITGNSVTVNWTPNPAAQGYQIFKLNSLTGQYETFKTITGGSTSGTTLTGLTPNTPYTLRVQAIDALGNFDGNVVSRSFTTTELVKLSMSAPVSTLAAGTPTTVTVQAFNANGTPQTVGGLPVVPSIASGTSSGTFSSVTDNNNGTYTFTFTPTVVGSAIVIDCSINITFFLNNTVPLSIIPGAASSANSAISISSGTVVSGSPVTVTATVRDAYNNPINSGQSVSFTKTGGTSTGSFSAINNQGNGVYSISYTGITAGTAQTLGIKVDAANLTPTTTIQVVPGTPVSANSTLTISSATIASGTTATVIATLKDINNNPVPSGVMVVFNKAGGTSSGTFDPIVNNNNGSYTTVYTGVTAGTAQTLSVSVDGVTLNPTVTVTVVPGPALLANSSLTITSPTVVSGAFVTVTATLKDVNNNPIDSGVTVSFTKTGGTSTGTFGTVTNQGNGVYNIRYTGVAAGTAQTIAVLINGTSLGTTVSVGVLTGAPSPTQSSITISNGTVISNQSVTVTATIKDDNNNPVTSGVAITFAKTGGTSTGNFGTVTNVGNGVYTITYTGIAAGTAQTIAVQADGSALGPTTTVTVVVGAPNVAASSFTVGSSSILSGQTTTLTATIKDINNNPISSGITVTFSKTGGTSTGTFGTVTNQGAGVYTITYTGVVSGTSQNLAVLINGSAFGSSTPITVLTAPPSAAQSSISISSGTVVSGQSVTVTATVKDLNNNPVTSGVAITFAKSGGSSTGTFSSVTNQGNGVYTLTYTGVVAGTAQTIALETDGTALGPTTTVAVLVGPPVLTNSSLTIGASTILSGETTTLTATIKDINNNPISSGSTITFAKTGGTSTGNFGTVTNQGGGVYTVTYTGIVSGTAQTLTVAINGTDLGASTTVTVLTAAPSPAKSSISISSGTVVSGQSVTVTATVKDLNNNPVVSGVAITFAKSGGSSTGTFGSITNVGNGVYTVTYTGVVAGSAQTIALETDGTSLGPTTSVSVLVGPPVLANSSLVVGSSTILSGETTTVTATIKDINNNPISTGSTIAFSKTGGTSTGTFGSVTNQGGGVYTVNYTGVVSGTAQTLGVSINGTDLGASTTVTVLTAAPSATKSSISISSGTVISGQSVTVTATVKDLNNNPVTSGVAISFAKAGGSSTGTFGTVTNVGSGVYTVTYTGVASGTAQTISLLTDGSALGPSVAVSVLNGAPIAANSTLTIGSSTVLSGQATTITATIKDVNNNPISSGVTVTFSKTSGTSTGTFGTITNQGAGVYTVTYTGVVAGTAQDIKILIDGVDLGLLTNVAVNPGAPSATTSTISVASSTVISGQSVTVTATIKDANSNPINSGVAVTFSKTGGSSTGTFGTITPQGTGGVYTVPYTGIVAGSAQTLGILIDGVGLGPTTTLSVTPGAPNNTLSTLTITSNVVIAGQYATLTATIKDANGNPISSGILVNFDKFGGTSFGNYSTVVNQGNGVYTSNYTGVTAGTAQTVQANVNGAGFGPTQSVQVLVGAPSLANSSLTVSSGTVASGSSVNITAVIKDSQNNPITSEYAITLDTIGGSSTGSLSSINNAGGGTFTATYTGAVAGSAQTLRVLADGTPIAGLTKTIQVLAGPASSTNSTFTISASTVQSGTIANLSMNLRDANNNAISSGATVTFTKATGVSDGTLSGVSNAGGGNYTATYTGTTMGPAQAINLVVNGTAVGLSVNVTVTAGPPTHFSTSQPLNPLASIDCAGPYTLTLKDVSENTTSSLSVVNLTFSSSPAGGATGTIFSDSSCSTPVTSLSIPVLTASAQFYYKAYIPNSFTFTLSPGGSITDASFTITNIPVLSWIGASAFFTMNGSGSGSVMDDSAGGMWNPYDIAVNGNNMFVVDYTGNRILKYDISTNQFIGWIGYVGSNEAITSYDSSNSCPSVAIGALTPIWCKGGRASASVSNATVIQNPRNIAADSTYIYVSSWSNHRIARFLQSDGSFQGWLGKTSTTAATSPASCVSAGTNATTPTWCYGGNSTSGTGDGQLNNPAGIIVYSGKIYVNDNGNHRISKYDASTGAYEGWVGRVGATQPPTSGQLATCSVQPAVGAKTPGWCVGGISQASQRRQASVAGPPSEVAAPDEGFYNPSGLTTDGTSLYVGDGNNYRIARITLSSGAFNGWLGYIYRNSALSPTTPSQTAGNFTSGWTAGGVTDARSGVDGWGYPYQLGYDSGSGYLFVADQYHRISKVRASDGGDFRWIGRAGGSPTGGYTGCSSTPVGGTNPGWCVNGSANKYGNTNGTFYTPTGLAVTSTKLYVADYNNFRVQRFNLSDGTFDGWIGSGNVPAMKWSRTIASGAVASRSGIDDYSFGDVSAAYAGIAMNSTYMFMGDVGWNRIKKYNRQDGQVIGYIGQIQNGGGFYPTGPDSCVGYTSGMTPDWCYGGGRTTSGAGIHGYNNPYSVAADSTYVYIANYSNHRIDRVRISDALYLGWIGQVNATPTDGDPACLTTNSPNPAPNWCIGGTATSNNVWGTLNAPRALFYDTAQSVIYATDNTSRLIKIDPSNGAFLAVGGTITAGAGGSNCGVTAGVANGWCTTSATGSSATTKYGGLNSPSAIATNSNYIFVADTSNNRIDRFDKTTGAPAGFVAKLNNGTNTNLTATGGACNGLSGFPKVTPGWCWTTTLGIAPSQITGTEENAYNAPRGVWADDTYVYIADTGNNRIVRIFAATGIPDGWKGLISSTSGMSDSACIAAGVGGVTPKWCKGGTSAPGQQLGAFDYPVSVFGDTNYIYVMDGRNNRVQAIPKN